MAQINSQRPIHPGRRFIDPNQGKSTSFSDSLMQVQNMFSSSAEQLGTTFSRSLESVTRVFSSEDEGVPISTEDARRRELAESLQSSLGSFKNFGGSTRAASASPTRKSPEPGVNGSRPDSWEDRQETLKMLRQQLHESKRVQEESKVAKRSIIHETAALQEQMQSPEVLAALARRKRESAERNKFKAEKDLHKDGLTYQVKLGPLKGTKTYSRRGELSYEELGG